MTAVSFDEAWGQAIGPTFETSSNEFEEQQNKIQQPRKSQRFSKHKSARYAENVQSQSIEHKKRKKEENETIFEDLIEKIQEIRQETTEEKIMRQAILYASIILIIILICINLITLNRLHYTTEALLLYVKHKS